MSAVVVEGLGKRYGSTTALAGVNFTVQPGEVRAVLGPNGAGKTTCVEILAGYRRADAGRTRVLGLDPARGRRGWRDRIGVLLQSTAVEAQLTVTEALASAAVPYRRPRSLADLIELLDLGAVAQRRSGELSGGQRRRLALAIALVGRPEVLFLDEPTTGFDPAARRATWEVVRRLAGDGTAVLLTTHYLEEAAQLADEVMVIVGGRIVARGDPATLGGDELAVSTVRFRMPAAAGFAPPDGLAPYAKNGVTTLRTANPTRLLAEVAGRAAGAGLELAELTVSRPTLEDVYLQLIAEETDG